MRPYLASVFVVLLAVACSGSSETTSQNGGGTSGSGGSNNGAGASAAGSAGNASAGNASAGSSSAGNDGVGGKNGAGASGAAGTGVAGSGVAGSGVVGGSGSGGAGSVDPRCPAKRPMGACIAADDGLACQYDNLSACLCYPHMVGTFTPCQKVDPTCSSAATGAAPAPSAGGASGKVAPPAVQVCSCTASAWSCHF